MAYIDCYSIGFSILAAVLPNVFVLPFSGLFGPLYEDWETRIRAWFWALKWVKWIFGEVPERKDGREKKERARSFERGLSEGMEKGRGRG